MTETGILWHKKTAYEKWAQLYILTLTSGADIQLFLGSKEWQKPGVRTGKEGERRYMKYVISDIYGMWDKYQSMLERIHFSAEVEVII